MSAEKYRVVLSGTLLPERSRAQVLKGLAQIFNSNSEKMQQVLRGKPVPLTKEYSYRDAQKICAEIKAVGADCEIQKIKMRATKSIRKISKQESPRDKNKDSKSDANDKGLQKLLDFVGTNKEYYQAQFAKFGSPPNYKFTLTWHWPAFFAFFFWAVYRKLWLWAGINLIGGLLLTFMVKATIIHLAWLIAWPLAANYIYFKHSLNCVHKNKKTAGGGSRRALGASIVLIVLVSIWLSDFIATQIINRQLENNASSLVQGGERLRGDGSSLDTYLDADTKKTLKAFDAILIALKISAPKDPAQINREKIYLRLQQTLASGALVDAWGNPISAQLNNDARIALRSSGSDGINNTADDILQYISIGNSALIQE